MSDEIVVVVIRRRPGRGILGVSALLACMACTHVGRDRPVSEVPAQRSPHGSFPRLLGAASADTSPDWRADPLVVLIERTGVRAIDPKSAQVRWYRPVRVTGHPAGGSHTVVLPLVGGELCGLDRHTGEQLWRVPLPGEGLTGIAVAEPYVAVTTIGEDGSSLLSLLSSRTGELTAMRSSRGRFGPPTFFGNVLLVTLEDNVLAIDPTGGREVARLALPADANGVDQIVVQHPAVVAIGHDRWISITGRQRPTRTLALDPPPFESDGYLDMGLDDGERLRWWVEFPSTGASPREAIMLARRAVLHLRLGPDGRPRTSHWAYVGPDQREFVAMHVGRAEVTLVLEDGGLLVLSREDGHEIDRVSGGTEARGALFLDFDRDQHELVRPGRPSAAERARMLAEVVDEQDPRVGPARRLAARLLRLNEEQQ